MISLSTGCASGGGTPPDNGPIRVRGLSNDDSISSFQASSGQVIAFGYNIVTNDGAEPIENIKVTLRKNKGSDLDVTFVPALVREYPDEQRDFLGVGPWPVPEIPEEEVRSLDGYKLEPGRTAELLILLRVNGDGRAFWPQTQLVYESGSQRYRATVRNGLLLCAPATVDCRPTNDELK
jgi:hypothetical protein